MRKLGFTLAEVLITLVIIGVIAAMTVPTLMNNTNAQEFRSALKKAISGANQALTLNYALEGMGAQDYANAADIVDDVFKKRMSVIDDDTWLGTGDGACDGSKFTTADGMKFCVTNWAVDTNQETSQTGACNSYNTVPCTTGGADTFNLVIDVNGAKKPNRLTTSADSPRDIYRATIYNQKVIPYGDAAQGVMFDKQVSTGGATTQLGNLNNKSNDLSDGSENNSENRNPIHNVDDYDLSEDPSYNEDDYTLTENPPRNPYDLYDKKRWPSWLDFLKWLLKMFGNLFDYIFG